MENTKALTDIAGLGTLATNLSNYLTTFNRIKDDMNNALNATRLSWTDQVGQKFEQKYKQEVGEIQENMEKHFQPLIQHLNNLANQLANGYLSDFK